jgi:hypothetical protein
MEATKCLKPSGSVSRIGDSASVQAATRVNAVEDEFDFDVTLRETLVRMVSKELQKGGG